MINEVMSDNKAVLQDEDGDYSDWIELKNTSLTSINVNGWYLTDSQTNLTKWALPSTTIQPGGFLIVFASGKDRAVAGAEMHTNFSLSKNGEYLALVRADGATIEYEYTPSLPVQSEDVSYGIAGSTSVDDTAIGYLQVPTPNAENSDVFSGLFNDKVTFSTPGGLFFGSTVSLTLSNTDPMVTIRYTIDGSIPNESSAAYSAPLSITATTLVKAAVFRPNYISGPLSQEGYIFADSSLSNFSSDVPILVIDTFNTAVPREDTTFREAAFAAYDPSATTGRTVLTDMQSEGGNSGIHVRGESSQFENWKKVSFAFETRNAEGDDKDVSLFGLPADSDWALHASYIDRTFIREQLPHRLFRDLGQYSPRTRPIEVFLNQDGGPVTEEDYQGLYILVERIRRNPDRVDIAKLEPNENTEPDVTGGFIFKKDKPDEGDVTVNTPNAGDFAVVYPNEKNITTAQKDYLENYLMDFETALLGSSFTDPEIGYAAYIDVQSWIDMHVIQELAKEADSYRYSTFYYKDKDGKIVCGPLWDFDRSLGNVESGGNAENPEGWNYGGATGEDIGQRGVFWDRLFEDPDFMQLYIDRWQELGESTLSETYVHSIIDTMAAEVDEAKDRNFDQTHQTPEGTGGPWPLESVVRSHLKFPTYAEHVTYLKDWVSDRLNWVETQFTAKAQFSQSPGTFLAPFSLGLSAPSGTIYYTTNGSDPRASGGAVAGTIYNGTIPINSTTTVIARVLDGSDWSGPLTGTFIVGESASAANLVVSEIMYHPAASTTVEINAGFADENNFEYIEFKNVSSAPIDLANATISQAFDYTFGSMEIAAGARFLLVRNQAAFEYRYGTGLPVVGEYGTQKLSNNGERILITAADASPIRDFTYDDGYDANDRPTLWPSAPDGDGFSLALIAPASPIPDHNVGSNWAASAQSGGNPGAVSPPGFVGDPNTDNDGDGVTALIEYALGTSDSNTSDAPYTLSIDSHVVGEDTADYLTMSFLRNEHAKNALAIQVQICDDLSSWTSEPDVVLVSETNNGDGTYNMVYRSAVPLDEQPSGREFIRIKVE